MENKKDQTKLIIEGNAVYEIDLECMKRKQKKESEKRKYEKGQGN